MSYINTDYTFMATASTTIANSSAETSAIPTGVGSLTFPANFMNTGTIIRLKGGGIFSTLITPGNLTVKMKLGSTVIASVVISNLLASASNNAFDFEGTIICRSTGASGSVVATGFVTYDTGVLLRGVGALNNAGGATTVDTTASQVLDVTVQWQTANAANTLTTTIASIEPFTP